MTRNVGNLAQQRNVFSGLENMNPVLDVLISDKFLLNIRTT